MAMEVGEWGRGGENLVRKKYIKKILSVCEKNPGQSHFFNGFKKKLMLFSLNFVENVLNGRRIRFCEDPWMGDKPLCEQFSRLYNLTFSTNIMVSDVF